MRDGICNGIVFHDFKVDKVDVKGLFQFMEQWFIDHGYPPNRAGYEARGLPKSEATKTFSYVKKSFEKINYQGIQEFSMMYVTEGGVDSLDYIFMGNYDAEEKLLYLMFNNEQYSFTQDHIQELIRSLIFYCSPKYGYAYQRDFKLGPTYYNIGMIMGLPKTEEYKYPRWQIAEWFRHYFTNHKYQTGQYRDIYPYNLICDVHLNQEIEGKTLREWIASNPKHGSLEKIKDNLWVWQIEEVNIPLVREALRPTGQVICI